VCYDSRRVRLPSPSPGGGHRGWRGVDAPGRPALLISVVVLGILASLDPLRPVVFVLVLRTRLLHAIAFLAGWTLALSVLFVLVFVTFTGGSATDPSERRGPAASIAEIAVGIVLVVIAARRWGRRHEDGVEGGYPAVVVRQLDRLDVRRAAFVGVLIQPRALTVAAALVVARDRSGPVSLLVGFVAFAVVSTAALLGILVYVVRRPDRATMRLTDVVAVLERQAPVIITLLFLAAGGYLVVDGVWSLLR
jgi:hypothetical protein